MCSTPQTDVISVVAGLLSGRELVAVTGGGGKSTLLSALAKRLRKDAAVVSTTTTHICAPRPEDGERLVLGPGRWDEWRAALRETGHVTIADSEEKGKLQGFSREAVEDVFREGLAPFVLVEADGAKRMPFKAYEAHEPVIPEAATLHIVVVGIEPFLFPLTEENTFRLHRFTERRGIKPGAKISTETIADILDDPNEYMKGTVLKHRRILLVNKCDLADGRQLRAIKEVLCERLRGYSLVLFASLQNRALFDQAETKYGGKAAVSA